LSPHVHASGLSRHAHAGGSLPGVRVSGITLAHLPGTLTGNCGRSPGIACRIVWDTTHSPAAARLTAVYLAHPIVLVLRLAFLAVLALLVRALVHKLIDRATQRAADLSIRDRLCSLPGTSARIGARRRFRRGHGSRAAGALEGAGGDPVPVEVSPAGGSIVTGAGTAPPGTAAHALAHERRRQRAHALGSILRSVASVTIFGIAVVTALGDLGVNPAPLLASAGVVGVAVGFGAQNLVKDFISGIFMLIEDQYGVGDVVTIDGATGTVEAVSLRVTRLRDVNGVVWHVRNGTIQKVGNESQGWARAVVDLPLPYDRDIARSRAVMEQVASAMWNDPQWRALMLEEPAVWGVQDISSSEIVMRVVVRTPPLRQWEVARELRQRLKSALDAADPAHRVES
jgi:small-conductance mechanosensitive channel